MYYFDSYEEFRQFALVNLDKPSTTIHIFEQVNYYDCYIIRPYFLGNRKVPKTNTAEVALMLTDDFANKTPDNFTEQFTELSSFVVPTRGATVEVEAKANAGSESMMVDNTVVKTINSGDTVKGVLQVFRASSDNLFGFDIACSGGVELLKEGFEYASDAALRAVWVASDTNNSQCYSESSIIYSDAYSMRVRVNRWNSNNDTVTRTQTSENLSAYDTIKFMFRDTLGGSSVQWRFRIGDTSNNWAYFNFSVSQADTWTEIVIPISSMSNILSVNLAAINKLQFVINSAGTSIGNAYFEEIKYLGDPGSAKVKLFDFGVSHPANGSVLGSALNFDDAVAEYNFNLTSNKNIVEVPKNIGVDNISNSLIKGNYYGIYIGDVSLGYIKIYGSLTQRYMSGKMFSVDASNLVVEEAGSAFFNSYTIVESILREIKLTFDNITADSQVLIMVMNKETMSVEKTLVSAVLGNSQLLNRDFYNEGMAAIIVDRSKCILIRYIDSLNSQMLSVNKEIFWQYKKITLYG